jgi:xanthine dehydrogenase accessory factor
MRKRSVPEGQRGLAPQVIGLGPNFTVGDNADLAVETSYEDLGRVLRSGSTLPLSGEPRPLAGVGRERYVYAPVAGLFQAILGLRAPVSAGQPVARIGEMVLAAPIGGAVRSLSRSGIAVTVGAKVIEIDPRGPEAVVGGIGERPRRIAQGVLEALGIPSSYTFAPAKCH